MKKQRMIVNTAMTAVLLFQELYNKEIADHIEAWLVSRGLA